MKNMRVVVLGGNGMLGHMVWTQFEKAGHIVFPSFRNYTCKTAIHGNSFHFDVRTHTDLRSVIPECDYLINCIGVIPQRVTPTDDQTLMMSEANHILPRRLGDLYCDTSTRVVHVTTDCVYSGKLGMYDEDSPCDAQDMYGMSKARGEPDTVMSLRTSIIGPETDSVGSNLFEWTKKQAGKTIDGYIDHIWNGLTTKALSNAMMKIIDENLYKRGTYHIFSDRPITKYQLVSAVNKKYKLGINIRKFATGMLVDRSLRSKYSLCEHLCIPTFEEMLKDIDE